jgi:hypothetical protein
MKIDLGVPELFDVLLEIKVDGQFIDLHNNYTCIDISYKTDKKEVIISFVADDLISTQLCGLVKLIFSEAEIKELRFPLVIDEKGLCLDSFYRGRIEQNSILIDETEEGKYLFYLDFYEGQSLEILAVKLVIGCSAANA